MAAIREQTGTGIGHQTNGRVELRDAAAAENKSLPIHRWVPWIAGFSAQFVEDAIDSYLPKRNRSHQRVLDPFAGVGTTLVEALKAGRPTIGYEINAFAALAAHAKVNCIDVTPAAFGAEVETFRSAMARFESDVDQRWGEGGEPAIADMLTTLREAGPRDFRSRIPFFSPPIEAKFLYALVQTAALEQLHGSLFRAALGGTMISFSNYSYEPSLSSRPGAGKALIENASVALPVCQRLDAMVEDMGWAQANYGASWRPREREVVVGSYFDSKLRKGSVSLLVTSPPYMNNYHYVRNTRPQLHWLGLIRGRDELRTYEQQSFGKFWQTVRQARAIDLDFDFPSVAALLKRLRGLSVDRGQYGGPGWANYVATYFNDCNRFLHLVRHQLKPGAHAIIVVGNSIIQGIEFKVDQLMAELAERQGLEVEDVRLVRSKRVGNSIVGSSVRNGQTSGQKPQLYDAAVILRA